MTEHPHAEPTPGPWKIIWPGDELASPSLKYPNVVGDGLWTVAHILGGSHLERRANAHLIAASWETAAERDRLVKVNERLVEALKALLHETELSGNANADDYGWPTVVPQARAALAEAQQQ